MNKQFNISSILMICALFTSQQIVAEEKVNTTINQVNEPLSIERIYSSPSLNGQTPKSLQFSPDGSCYLFTRKKGSLKSI